MSKQGYTIDFSDDLRDFLADEGFDPAFGARPLKRAIQRYVENTLAEYMLSNYNKDETNLHLDIKDKQVQVSPYHA